LPLSGSWVQQIQWVSEPIQGGEKAFILKLCDRDSAGIPESAFV